MPNMTKPSQPPRGEPVMGLAVPNRITEGDLTALLRLHSDANAALMAGEARTFAEMLQPAKDFTIMDPFGGTPSHGFDASPAGLQRLGRFFRAGTMEVDPVAAYAAGDLAVLAVIERTEVEVGGLPRQPWALRVTVAYRREGSGWRLVHRHADPLRGGLSVEESAALARRHEPSGQVV
jgi:ketosteroid isomerase-like protein